MSTVKPAAAATRTGSLRRIALNTTNVDVTFEGVSKRFADGTVGVDGIDLHCPAGRITVFVGPSGCGKTTSLRMVNRMIAPSGGRITIGDMDVATLDEASLRRQMGYVIQNAGLFPHRRIIDNITTVPRLLGTPRTEARERAAALMERVGLDESLARKFPYQLSGGQQQRVGVARALAADPPVLLMDEPFSAVDPVVRAELQDELLRLQRDIGKTILFVTHDIDEAVRIADQIVVFQRGGTIAQAAPPETILTAPANDFVRDFVGNSAGVKWLSLIPGNTVTIPAPGTAEEAGAGQQWRIDLDELRHPTAWRQGTASDGPRLPLGKLFRPTTESLRDLMEALVTSPLGRVAAVDEDGSLLGVVDHTSLAEAVSKRKAAA